MKTVSKSRYRARTIIACAVILSLLVPLTGTLQAQAPAEPEPLHAETPLPSGPPQNALVEHSSSSAPLWEPLAPPLATMFDGANFDTNVSLSGGWAFIPPDPSVAAGPDHVVSVVNVTIEWYTKNGTRQSSQLLRTFFSSLSPANYLFDPKVLYDQYENRFVVVALEKQDDRDGNDTGDSDDTSRILLAVSDDNDPNGTWYFQAINSKLNIGGTDRWADYPGFAVDDKAVYVTCNMFGFGNTGGYDVRLWIVDKGVSSGFYNGGAATVNVYDPIPSGGYALTLQPAHTFGTPPGNMGVFLAGYSGLTDSTNEYLEVIRVENPLGSPTFTLVGTSSGFVPLGNIDGTTVSMPDAPQQGSAQRIDTGDRRTYHAVWRDNTLWTATHVVPPTGADSGQATVHWIKLDTTNTAAVTLADQGNVGGEDVAAGAYTFYPSIAVDSCGNMGLGFAVSASSIYAGAYYTGRLAGDAAGTVQPTSVLAAGTDWYYRAFGGSRNRWGDYSGLALDPDNEATFWAYNEYAMTRGTVISGEDGRWATRFGAWPSGLDFGDLPITYTLTLYEHNGARHGLSDLYLGTHIDADPDGQPFTAAQGDDTNGLDDEDGVSFSNLPWQVGASGGQIQVVVSGGNGCLAGWIDWDGDGTFSGSGEQILSNQAVVPGTNTITFTIPSKPAGGWGTPLYARFRLYPRDSGNTCTTPRSLTGLVCSGEVEDYAWNLIPDVTTGYKVFMPVVLKQYTP